MDMVDYDAVWSNYGATIVLWWTMMSLWWTMVPLLWWTMVDTTMVALDLDLDLDHLPRSLAEQDDHCPTFVQFCCSRTERQMFVSIVVAER